MTGSPLGIPLAAGLLYPFVGVLLNPVFAALAMAFSSVSVVTNALRLRSFRPPDSSATSSTAERDVRVEPLPA